MLAHAVRTLGHAHHWTPVSFGIRAHLHYTTLHPVALCKVGFLQLLRCEHSTGTTVEADSLPSRDKLRHILLL